MIGPSAETLIRMGAKDSYLIVVENEAWRLVSSTILHAGLVHFFINMLALWFIGSAIETCHGSIAASILFFIPAVGGTVLSALFLPEYITVGASGGIFGYIGACLSDIVMNWKLLFCDFVTENGKKHHHVMVLVILVLDIVLNCVIGLTPYVDNFTRKSFATRTVSMWVFLRNGLLFSAHNTTLSSLHRLGWHGVWFPLWLVDDGTPFIRLFRHGTELLDENETSYCSILWCHCQCDWYLDCNHHSDGR